MVRARQLRRQPALHCRGATFSALWRRPLLRGETHPRPGLGPPLRSDFSFPEIDTGHSGLIPCREWLKLPPMKSCLGMLISLALLIAILGTLGGIFYLSYNIEFSRQESPR